MKGLRKLALLSLVATAFCAVSGTAFAGNRLDKIMKAGKITVCTEPYFAPYEFIDNTKTGQDQYRGGDMELARYLADKLGVKLEIVPLAWDALLAGVAQGKYDIAISGMSYTPTRARSLEFTNEYRPDYDGHSIVVRKADADKYKSFDDFNGKTVAYQSGTLQELIVETQLPKAKKKIFDSVQNAVLAVDAGKVDGVAVAVLNGDMFVASHPSLYMLPLRFNVENLGCVIAAPKGEVELVAKLNEIIAEVKEKDLYSVWEKEALEEAAKLGIK